MVLDDVIVLYPFEQEWYAKKNLQTSWHGWPRYQEFTHYKIPKTKECTLALLPGSRRNELERMIPCFYQVAEQLAHLFPDLQFHWMVPHMFHEHHCFDAIKNGALRERMTLSEIDHDRLASCCAALSKLGTITLELALLHVPTIIAFNVSWLTYTLASWCVQLPWVGLPNILLKKEVMPELLHEKCTPAAIVPALRTLITQWQQNTDSYHATLDDCATLHRLMHQAHSV